MITTRHKLTRYGTSLAVVLGVHAVAIIIALQWSAPHPVTLPPAAMVTVEPVKAVDAAGGEAGDSSLRQYVVAPAMKVVDVVSGAAGSVQAAGSWTLTQANGLLPRW